MWNRIVIGYLKRIRRLLIWFPLGGLCFGVVFYLYDLPIEAAGYGALLALFFGMVFLALDIREYSGRCRSLEAILRNDQPIPEDMMESPCYMEQQYQKLAERIYDNKMEMERGNEDAYRDLVDYYSLWAHQIKTPISALNLLLQTEDGNQKSHREMSMELFKIQQYTDMALQYIRLGSTANDFVFREYDVDDLIRQALRKYAKMFIGRRLSLEFTETEQKVITDEKWMVFVMEQILSNALKYTDKGKISIYPLNGNEVVIEDTGMGISAEDLPRIFEKGYTGFNGRADKKATGLGLYFCRQILDKLSHEIRVESTQGAGTKVILTFSF